MSYHFITDATRNGRTDGRTEDGRGRRRLSGCLLRPPAPPLLVVKPFVLLPYMSHVRNPPFSFVRLSNYQHAEAALTTSTACRCQRSAAMLLSLLVLLPSRGPSQGGPQWSLRQAFSGEAMASAAAAAEAARDCCLRGQGSS